MRRIDLQIELYEEEDVEIRDWREILLMIKRFQTSKELSDSILDANKLESQKMFCPFL